MEHLHTWEDSVLSFTPSTPMVGGPDDRLAEWAFTEAYIADTARRAHALRRAGHPEWRRCSRLFNLLRFSPSEENARGRWELFEATLSEAFADLAFAAWEDAEPEDLEWRDD
jgi:hypothetical protein